MPNYEVKFRVYEEINCRKCKVRHPMPAARGPIRHTLTSGNHTEAIGKAHRWAVKVLNAEGRNHRPIYQGIVTLPGD